jgi:hypothetical protein
MAAALVVGTVWGVADWTGDTWLTMFAVIVLVFAVAPFFVPTAFRLTPDGVEVRRPWRSWRRPWSDFRAVRSDRDLIVLSPFERRSWLDAIRGETLFLGENRGEVLAYVETMVGGEAGGEAHGNH